MGTFKFGQFRGILLFVQLKLAKAKNADRQDLYINNTFLL